MKRLYYFGIVISVIIFGKWIIDTLPSFSTKLFTVLSDSMQESSFSTVGEFGFKSTPEREDLILASVNINSQFLSNPPIEFRNEEKPIKGFYKIVRFFPEFKYYYLTKLKVTDTLTNELPILLEKVSGLTESEMDSCFNENKEYLERKWGINNSADLYSVVIELQKINGQKVISREVTDSFFSVPELGTVCFRVKLTLEDNSTVYLSIDSEVLNSNEYQAMPLIRFYGRGSGGIS